MTKYKLLYIPEAEYIEDSRPWTKEQVDTWFSDTHEWKAMIPDGTTILLRENKNLFEIIEVPDEPI